MCNKEESINITPEQKQTALQSFNNLLYDVKGKFNSKNLEDVTQSRKYLVLTQAWTAQDVENVIYFINLRLGERNALEGKSPLSLRCALMAGDKK